MSLSNCRIIRKKPADEDSDELTFYKYSDVEMVEDKGGQLIFHHFYDHLEEFEIRMYLFFYLLEKHEKEKQQQLMHFLI